MVIRLELTLGNNLWKTIMSNLIRKFIDLFIYILIIFTDLKLRITNHKQWINKERNNNKPLN